VSDFAEPGYVPSNQDILQCRRETTDLQKVEFQVDIPAIHGGGVQRFVMYDIGGQREHRHKMVYVFADIQVKDITDSISFLFFFSTSLFPSLPRARVCIQLANKQR
jgi:hypothetical protein